MKIKYYGNSSFLCKTKQAKLITNPKSEGVKVNLKKLAPDIIVLSHKEDIETNDYYLVSSCGEYEIKEVFVYGFSSDISEEEEIADIYMFDIEGVQLGMVDKSVRSIKESILDEMGVVNVLFVSLSNDAAMKMSKMTDLVNKIEPQIVIPMDITKEKLEEFTKALGVKEVEKMGDVDVKQSDFFEEDMPMRVVVLEG
ncbi:MBL fold metallo-hydrolase [Candidatus Dojkabacteria bacterium]|nr:MBL fold metallo-hydrolase [Candidatus Dojkabacteria bacterium]